MTNLPGEIQQTVGNTFGLRTWVEYGFKDDLGWADYRVTDAASIARWWELVMSAYTLVSLQSPAFAVLGHLGASPPPAAPAELAPSAPLQAHPAWDTSIGWTHSLTHLRLLPTP